MQAQDEQQQHHLMRDDEQEDSCYHHQYQYQQHHDDDDDDPDRNHQGSMMMDDDDAMIEQKGSFAELVVKAAAACNRMLIENCSVCTLYCDKQVQYETTSAVMERYVTGSALTDLFRSLEAADQQVDEFRGKLFDEQSVVESVSSRLGEDY